MYDIEYYVFFLLFNYFYVKNIEIVINNYKGSAQSQSHIVRNN